MRYEFDKVAILCTEYYQVLHLASLAIKNEHRVAYLTGVINNTFGKYFFNRKPNDYYSNYDTSDNKPVVTYADFIAGMQEPETQVVEVTGCKDCILYYSDSEGFTVCQHPNRNNTELFLTTKEFFSTCPLKKGAVTIKLKK